MFCTIFHLPKVIRPHELGSGFQERLSPYLQREREKEREREREGIPRHLTVDIEDLGHITKLQGHDARYCDTKQRRLVSYTAMAYKQWFKTI